MKISFINHASVLCSEANIRLITDPWIEGEVFHNGWSLLSKTQFTYQDFKDVTHIWFSHEHPDHFFPPNIKAIPEEIRKEIVVIYQQTDDKKVIEFCQKLGFKEVIELEEHIPYRFGELEIINGKVGHDSWLLIRDENNSYLNTNDCVLNTPQLVESIKKVTGEIDVLLTQFSYANKVGNVGDIELRKKAVEEKNASVLLQIECFKPKYLIPMASYVWFSHEENFYMNQGMGTVDKLIEFVQETCKNTLEVVVMYPADEYEVGQSHKNDEAINRYEEDIEKVTLENTRKTKTVPLEKISQSGDDLRNRLRKKDRLAYLLISLFPIKVYITDLDKTVQYSVINGLKILSNDIEAHIQMSSEVLDYCLAFDWGFGATNVNARYITNSQKGQTIFNYYFSVTDSLNHEDSTLKRVVAKIKRKF